MEDKIYEELKSINDKLDIIIDLVKDSKKGSDKMTEHIDFVESIYTTLKNPINGMLSLMPSSKSLPDIDMSQDKDLLQ